MLLPPSETKRDGGIGGTSLDLAALSFPELARPRRTALAALRATSKSVSGSMKALKLGPTQRFEIDRNRAIGSSALMPAVERYTGVLYDALGATTLPADARSALGRSAIIHSALFGLVAANDPIPAYRFSHDTRIAGTSIAKLWAEPHRQLLEGLDGLILDLRSEAYVHLGPAPANSFFLRVVTSAGDGEVRALNHFNKHGKGHLVRALALSGHDFASVDELLDWAPSAGITLRPGAPGEVMLII